MYAGYADKTAAIAHMGGCAACAGYAGTRWRDDGESLVKTMNPKPDEEIFPGVSPGSKQGIGGLDCEIASPPASIPPVGVPRRRFHGLFGLSPPVAAPALRHDIGACFADNADTVPRRVSSAADMDAWMPRVVRMHEPRVSRRPFAMLFCPHVCTSPAKRHACI